MGPSNTKYQIIENVDGLRALTKTGGNPRENPRPGRGNPFEAISWYNIELDEFGELPFWYPEGNYDSLGVKLDEIQGLEPGNRLIREYIEETDWRGPR